MNEPLKPKLNIQKELREIATGARTNPAAKLRDLGYRIYTLDQRLDADTSADVAQVIRSEFEID